MSSDLLFGVRSLHVIRDSNGDGEFDKQSTQLPSFQDWSFVTFVDTDLDGLPEDVFRRADEEDGMLHPQHYRLVEVDSE
ncbi:MAG: hypothetical protein JXR94_12790 [Candidatus Hydrogenedentes bacterium]|nr:hypothetical protein [Candidatus Hydrogenedentota bacterium]